MRILRALAGSISSPARWIVGQIRAVRGQEGASPYARLIALVTLVSLGMVVVFAINLIHGYHRVDHVKLATAGKGGEIAMWMSKDAGLTWAKVRQLTRNSDRNHTYVRRPVNAHPDFYAMWADGHGRKPSESALYFCDKRGNVRRLPREMKENFVKPEALYGRDPDLNSDGVLNAEDFAILAGQ